MATTPLLVRRTALLAKAEATPGTAETLTAADGKFLVINPTITNQFEVRERQVSRDTNSNVPKTVTRKVVQITFQTEVRRSNSTTTPDAWGSTLMPACGFKQTVGASSVSYTPSSTQSDWHTLTMGMNIDGRLVTIAGAMGDVEFPATVSEEMLVSWTFTGFLSSQGDVALPTVTHETGVPFPFQGIGLAYGTGTRFVVASDSTAATAGTFTLTVDGQTTGTIAYDDDGTATATALETLFPDSTVTTTMLKGTDLGDNLAIMLVEVSHIAHKAVTIDGSSLTGSAHRMASTCVEVTAAATAATGGTFGLTFDSNGTNLTATIAYNANATAIEAAIDALSIFTASEAIYETGTALSTNNANVFILCDLDTSGGFTNYHAKINTTSLTGNAHTLDAHTQEIATGDDVCIESLSISMGNDVQLLTCANNDSGVSRYTIVDRNPTVTLNPQLTLASEVDGLADYWGHFEDQEMVYLSFRAGKKGTVNSRVSFVLPEVFIEDLGQSDRNGIAVVDLTGSLTSDTAGGDDELTITMT